MDLSVIIPAYNEEDRIVHTLDKTINYLSRKQIKSEILVVSDGSRDGTKRVVESFKSSENVDVKFFEYFPNRGKGHAVKYGMLKGDGDLILFMDADYSVPIEYIEEGIRLMESGADIAIASRALDDSLIIHHQSFVRELSGKIYTLIQNLYLGIKFRDTQCGFKIFTKEVAKELFSLQKLNSVIFDPEILWLGCKKGYITKEFPVKWEHQEDSRIVYDSIDKFLFVFRELLSIRKIHR